ncbi:hypothetical protein BJ546DRAFT_947389 [Cryomyces antarcticus]
MACPPYSQAPKASATSGTTRRMRCVDRARGRKTAAGVGFLESAAVDKSTSTSQSDRVRFAIAWEINVWAMKRARPSLVQAQTSECLRFWTGLSPDRRFKAAPLALLLLIFPGLVALRPGRMPATDRSVVLGNPACWAPNTPVDLLDVGRGVGHRRSEDDCTSCFDCAAKRKWLSGGGVCKIESPFARSVLESSLLGAEQHPVAFLALPFTLIGLARLRFMAQSPTPQPLQKSKTSIFRRDASGSGRRPAF